MTFILVAVEQELEPKDLPGFRLDYTGVGKINAAVKTLAIIKEFSPSLIINYGTAGRLNETLSGLVEVSRFVQRDMDATALGFKLGQTPFDDVAEIDFGNHGYSCGSGDSFVTRSPKLKTDLVDMEAYAMAKICYLHNVDFRCFKYISDNADDAAHDDWASNVAHGKKLFIEKMQSLQVRPTVTI
jgi:adenosylhomocysteine nucleosidase